MNFDTPSLYPFIESYLERDELLLLLREEVEALLRELLLLDALLCDEALRLPDTLLRLVLLLLLRDTLLLRLVPLLALRDTLLLDELLRELDTEDALARGEADELLREVLALVFSLRRVVVALPLRPVVEVERLLAELLVLTARLDPVRLGVLDVTAVRRFSSELNFTIRLFLSREGTLTYPFLRSRRLFS